MNIAEKLKNNVIEKMCEEYGDIIADRNKEMGQLLRKYNKLFTDRAKVLGDCPSDSKFVYNLEFPKKHEFSDELLVRVLDKYTIEERVSKILKKLVEEK